MPPPPATGCTPLTPNPNAVAIGSLRRTLNPTSATYLFPDETPDTDRCNNTTETAHFLDIDEDDPSPPDGDLIPQAIHVTPTNTTEFHRASHGPSPPRDHDDEPPSIGNVDLVVQTQHDTPPQQPNDPSQPHDDDDEPLSMGNVTMVPQITPGLEKAA